MIPTPELSHQPPFVVSWTCAPTGEFVKPQPAWMTFTGQDVGTWSGRSWTDALHPDDATGVIVRWTEALAQRRPFAEEVRLRRADGEWRWTFVSAAPSTGTSQDADSPVVEWVGTAVDIMDRRRDHERLLARVASSERAERKRRHFAALVEQSTDLIGFASLDGQALYVNQATSTLLGLTDADGGQPLTMTDLTAPEDRRLLAERVVPHVLAGGVWKGELLVRHAVTGQSIPMEQVVFPLVNPQSGATEYIATIARDIRERREADRVIRASEQRFQRAAEAVSGFIYELSFASGLLTTTSGIGPLLGLSSLEPIAYEAWLERIHPDERAHIRDEWARAWRDPSGAGTGDAGAGAAWRTEYRLRHRDGHYVDVWDHAVFERDEAGQVIRAVGHIIDISQRRRAEERLLVADRKKNEFLAVLAHELRNPLAPIRNGLQIMEMAAGNATAVERARAIVSRQVEQMTHLIDELMDVSRISQGRITVHRQRMRLGDALRNAVDSARPLLEGKGHHFEFAQPADAIWVDGDLLRLSQVCTNILGNAAKYTPPGGLIRLRVEVDRGDVLVSVEDNGIGIPADKLADVFEMFVQVDRSTDVSRGGLGLGLHIARRLVVKHGGSITVESGGEQRGSCFTVRLPTLPATADVAITPEAQPPSADDAGADRSHRILVVEDNRDSATALTTLLELMGNQTRTAHDGEEAIELAEAFRPHLVLMDIGMPGLNGYDACRRMRAAPWSRGMVIVAQTGWGQEEDRRRALAAGFDSHLTKPVDPREVKRLLRDLASP